MKNFGRVLRLSLRYRWTFTASIVCALIVGALWGANIGTIYPFIKVAFQNESLQQWVDREIADSLETAREKTAAIEQLHGQLAEVPAGEQHAIRNKISIAEARVEAEHEAVARLHWLKPYIDRYLPADPFQTLALCVGVLLLGTLIKDVFLIGNTILIARLSQLGTFRLRKLFYRRTLRMDLARFHNEGTSDLMARFTFDMENVATNGPIVGRWKRWPNSTTPSKRPSGESKSSRPSPWNARSAGGSISTANSITKKRCGSPDTIRSAVRLPK
jgi:ATP-binding cassette subfamily B protein/subfamily B ATP-binding cassette protein MsbA